MNKPISINIWKEHAKNLTSNFAHLSEAHLKKEAAIKEAAIQSCKAAAQFQPTSQMVDHPDKPAEVAASFNCLWIADVSFQETGKVTDVVPKIPKCHLCKRLKAKQSSPQTVIGLLKLVYATQNFAWPYFFEF